MITELTDFNGLYSIALAGVEGDFVGLLLTPDMLGWKLPSETLLEGHVWSLLEEHDIPCLQLKVISGAQVCIAALKLLDSWLLPDHIAL